MRKNCSKKPDNSLAEKIFLRKDLDVFYDLCISLDSLIVSRIVLLGIVTSPSIGFLVSKFPLQTNYIVIVPSGLRQIVTS
jgi:hypothetical protein